MSSSSSLGSSSPAGSPKAAVTAKSFKTDDHGTDLFATGNFSAKYATRSGTKQVSLSESPLPASSSVSRDRSGSPGIQTGDVKSSNPLMIAGGFAEASASPMSVSRSGNSLAHINTTIQNRDVAPRRNSILSSQLSSSLHTSGTVGTAGTRGGSIASSNDAVHTIAESMPGSPSIADPRLLKAVDRHLVHNSDENESQASADRADNADRADRADRAGRTGRTTARDNSTRSPVRSLNRSPARGHGPAAGSPSIQGAEFDSLQLKGGDTTRGIYNWVNKQKEEQGSALRRVASSGSIMTADRSRRSTDVANPAQDSDQMSVQDILTPGGFRRSFLVQKRQVHDRHQRHEDFFARNFLEFLAVYGHFAGEDLSEEEEEDTETPSSEEESEESSSAEEEYSPSDYEAIENEEGEQLDLEYPPPGSSPTRPGERSMGSFVRGRKSLQSFGSPAARPQPGLSTRAKIYHIEQPDHQTSQAPHHHHTHRHHHKKSKKTSTTKSFLLLLKAFIGTGVVFLPKSFANGGLLFCNLMIVAFSLVSYYCFVILIQTVSRTGVKGYGDVGGQLLGKQCKQIILTSLALSQLGFSSSYVVFVAENFKYLAETLGGEVYTVGLYIFLQPLLFIPLSLTRKIGKLGATALIADLFIFLGLIYIYFQSTFHLSEYGLGEGIALFQRDTWSLFIGTAVFAYEGIGLIIPIQESMEEPEKFNRLLFIVIVITTVVFTTLPTIAYLAYGAAVKTVILMNFPKNAVSLVVQLLYTIAILLSTPIQLFPAIKIIENYCFDQKRRRWKRKIRRNSEARSLMTDYYYGSTSSTPLSAPAADPSPFQDISPSKSPSSSNYNEHLVNDEGIVSGKSDWKIKWLKNLLRVFMVLLMCTIAYVGSDNLDHFVSLIGSFTCVPLIYIYPPLLYLKCFKNTIGKAEALANYMISFVGVCLLLYTSYETLSTW